MRFLSVCSGIEAASVASAHLGWEAAGFAEIEPFCCDLLKTKYPNVKNYGDFTTICGDELGTVDLVCGGTPCQDFSVAGARAGLDGARGNLTLEFVRLVERVHPRWVFWENVPGVLSIDGGRAFGAFLGALGQLGYGFAHRVLDAQHFGVPQRRRRVFVVGYLGDWRPSAAVLFEPESVLGYPPPRRKAGKGTTHELASSLTSSGRGVERPGESSGQDPVIAMCLNAKGGGGRIDAESETFVATGQGYWSDSDVAATLGTEARSLYESTAVTSTLTSNEDAHSGFRDDRGLVTHSLRADGFDASEDGTGRGTPLVATGWNGDSTPKASENVMPCMRAEQGGEGYGVQHGMAVRRLTPRECERLQGFPDDYTLIERKGKPAADGPRYKALGNSWAVPCVRWIFDRIDAVDRILNP